MSEELKIVITTKGNTASVGVQETNCDPIFSLVTGDLAAVLGSVPGVVDEARRRWDSNPRYPKCETKLEPPPQPVRERSSPRQTQTTLQPPMF